MNERTNIKNNFSIRWVIALKEEAKTIIDHYEMKLVKTKSLYRIFKNIEETHWLVISGIGRHNAAAATTYLYLISCASRSTAWINLGIAGSGKGNYGDLCLVDKISTINLKSKYPAIIKNSGFLRMKLLTTDFPHTDYSSNELIDMEGMAFYDIASKITSHQLICIIKVISDGPENDIHKLNNNKIFNLINSNVNDIKKIITNYQQLSNSDWSRRQKPRLFDYVTTKSHFSVSQKHQLESLLRRIKIILNDDEILEMIKDCKNSSSIINTLDTKIRNNEVDWSNS